MKMEEKKKGGMMVGIKELVDSGLHEVPPLYILPPHERPDPIIPSERMPCDSHIPVLDLTHLHADDGHEAAARSLLIQELGRACEEWGFFQVVNHGIEPAKIQCLRAAALAFFEQRAEQRMRFYNKSFYASVCYSTSFNPSQEKVREWKDTLSFNRLPGVCDGFQEAPDICKKELQQYIQAVGALAGRLYKAIFESLGVHRGATAGDTMCADGHQLLPTDPSLTLGVSSHSDVSCLTVLHPDDVPGFQIKHKGGWVPVFPFDPSAFVINLADQIEILTNGRYKSVEHRAVPNREKPRMSITCFFGPTGDTIVAPLPKLLGENHPPRYKPTKFEDYANNFSTNRLLADRGTLDFARIPT